MFNKIHALFVKPFPVEESNWVYLRNLVLLSLFVFFFLMVFEPFGLDQLDTKKFIYCLGFGFMTFFGGGIYHLVFHRLFKIKSDESKWTFWKWIIDNLGIMLVISLANFLFIRICLFGYIDWSLLPTMIYSTFMIWVTPIVALGAFMLIKSEQKFRHLAADLDPKQARGTDDGSVNQKELYGIHTDQIKYVEALQNYARITFIQNNQLDTLTERVTLKQLREELEGTNLIQCHRSFLVNKSAISSIEGNAQGLLLTLSDCETKVPVSRSHVNKFR